MMTEKTLRVLEFTRIREMLAEGALTETGAEKCRKLTPYDDLPSVEAAQAGSELPPVRNLRGDGTFQGWCLSETGPVISDPIIVPYGGLILYARWLTTPPPYTDFLLPDSLENAGEEAFAGLSLRSVRVPATVKEIGPRAFADCGSLKVVYFEGWDTSIHETAFENAPADLVFYGFADSTAAATTRMMPQKR